MTLPIALGIYSVTTSAILLILFSKLDDLFYRLLVIAPIILTWWLYSFIYS